MGSRWIAEGMPGPFYCNPAGRSGHVAGLGILYATMLFFCGVNWVCWHTCCICCPSETYVPVAALLRVQSMMMGGTGSHGYTPAVQGQPVPPPVASPFPPPFDEVARGGPRGDNSFTRACTPGQLCKLIVCIIIDIIGDLTYLLPAEEVDLAWAPIQALLLKMLFDGGGVAFVGLVEEFLPFTDVLPTACLAWCLETVFTNSTLTRRLGLCPVIVSSPTNQPRSGSP